MCIVPLTCTNSHHLQWTQVLWRSLACGQWRFTSPSYNHHDKESGEIGHWALTWWSRLAWCHLSPPPDPHTTHTHLHTQYTFTYTLSHVWKIYVPWIWERYFFSLDPSTRPHSDHLSHFLFDKNICEDTGVKCNPAPHPLSLFHQLFRHLLTMQGDCALTCHPNFPQSLFMLGE